MELPVTLNGHRAAWVYRGSRELGAWLESQPWLRGGGVVRLRLGTSTGDIDLLVDGLRRAVRGADEAGHQPVVASLPIVDKLVSTLQAELCGAAEADERRVVDECSFKHRLILCITESGGPIAAEARAFSDRARKVAPDFATAFVIISTGSDAAEGDELDFTSGAPDDHVLRLLDDTQDRLFRSYLHARVAWESAGAINRARSLETVLRSVRVGDDEAVENGLNEFARQAYGCAMERDKRRLVEFLAAIARGAVVDARRVAPELGNAGLLWSPFGRERWRVVPWTARALLLDDIAGESALLLRSQLTCAPLAREILGRCLELEARERAKLARQIGASRPPPDAVARLESFQRPEARGDALFYPRSSPARPRDAWAFAEFGAFVETAERAGAPRRQVSELHALRLLRNGLAHGHYAGWVAVRRLIEIEGRLGVAV